jgi:hypothetical protein
MLRAEKDMVMSHKIDTQFCAMPCPTNISHLQHGNFSDILYENKREAAEA